MYDFLICFISFILLCFSFHSGFSLLDHRLSWDPSLSLLAIVTHSIRLDLDLRPPGISAFPLPLSPRVCVFPLFSYLCEWCACWACFDLLQLNWKGKCWVFLEAFPPCKAPVDMASRCRVMPRVSCWRPWLFDDTWNCSVCYWIHIHICLQSIYNFVFPIVLSVILLC